MSDKPWRILPEPYEVGDVEGMGLPVPLKLLAELVWHARPRIRAGSSIYCSCGANAHKGSTAPKAHHNAVRCPYIEGCELLGIEPQWRQ